MAPTAADQMTATMDDKLAAYWELVEKRESLEARLRKAESEKASVSPRIYEKVTAEYDRELREISERLEPVKEALDDARKQVERAIEEIDREARTIAEQLSEATFRHRVGEFTSEQYQAVVEKHRPDVEALRKRRAEHEAQLDAFDRRRRSDSRSSGNAARAPMPEAPTPRATEKPVQEKAAEEKPTAEKPAPEKPAPEKAAPDRPTLAKAAAEKPADEPPPAPEETPDYVDPSNWFDDTNDDPPPTGKKAKAAASKSKAKEEEDDPLAALADPSDGADASDSSDHSGSYPSLVIKAGPHAGKMLPLLPMTMSIGREHDNNIELKDPEVARYHARIVYERGQFAIEDLESSSGTFINGQRTRRAQLAEGDIIRLGTTELAMTYDS